MSSDGISPQALTEAQAAWHRGDVERAGHLLYRSRAPAARPRWAGEVLAAASRGLQTPPEIRHVLELAANPVRWHEAHKAFNAVRLLTLQQEKAGRRRDELFYALLFIAENTAKVTYNASRQPAPFEEDCGDWIALNVRDLLEASPNPELRVAMEAALFSTE
jgi:hypothetical protein